MKRSRVSQEEILQKMSEGWELGQSTGYNSRFWLQRPKLCCGGESIDLHLSTVFALIRKEKIKHLPKKESDPYWLERYGLAEE